MTWRDTFREVGDALEATPTGSRARTAPRVPSLSSSQQRSSSARFNWSDLATGRFSPDPVTKPRAPASFPERVDLKYPYSSTGSKSPYAPPGVPAPSTEGDWGASIGASIEQVASNIRLDNFVPYLQERVNVLANDLATSDIPGVKEVSGVASKATQAFIDGVATVMRPVGEVMDALPAWVRDSQLKDRAKLYRAIANGETPDYGWTGPMSNPLASAGTFLSLLANPAIAGIKASQGETMNQLAPLTGQTVSEQAYLAGYWQRELLNAVDPQRRLDAETRLAIMTDSVDLPESVKSQIARKPKATDDEIAAWLDEAPEGKQWSYAEGPAGIVQNMGTDLLFLIAQARTGLLLGKGAGAFAKAASVPGGAGTYAGVGRAAAQVIGPAGRAISISARLQTAAMATGVGVTAVNATMGTIARYQGADAAIEWWDNATRSTEFSDDPMIQLSTSFITMPFAAGRLAQKGAGKVIVTLKHGLVDVPLDRLTARRFVKFVNDTDQLNDLTRRMYNLGSNEEAAAFLDAQDLRPHAHNMIVGTALDMILDKLPKGERIAWNALNPDPIKRAGATMERYGRRALAIINKNPELVATKFHEDWSTRMSTLPFHAGLAAKIARDFHRNVDLSYDLRQEQRLVVGYREALPPQGQAYARSMLDGFTGADGMVAIDDLSAMVVDLPVLRKHLGGVPTTAPLPRAAIERMIDSAATEWAIMAKQNPRKAATGIDPVLRPDSPTLQRDYADALGTNIETVRAVSDTNPAKLDNTQTDLLRRFLVDKNQVDEATAAAMTPENLWSKASDYIDDKTKPWLALGERVSTAEASMARLRSDLARVKREGGSVESDRTIRIQRDINELADLVRLAGDPIQTAAARAAAEAPRLGDSHLVELASRKLDALERLRVVKSVDDDLRALGLTESDLSRVVTGVDGELADAFDVAGAPPTPLLNAFISFRTANMNTWVNRPGEWTSRRQSSFELSQKGMRYVDDMEKSPGSFQWAEIVKSPGFVKRLREVGDKPAFYTDMTGNQMADMVEAVGVVRGVSGVPLDEIAAKMTETRGATAKANLASVLGGKDPIKAGREGAAREANLRATDAQGGTRGSGGAIKGEAPGPVTREQALEHLAQLRAAREAALDGKGVASIKRTSEIKVPDDYVAQAEVDRAAQTLVYDAEYDAFFHPRNVAKVQEITQSPDELWPSLRGVVEGDAELMEGVVRVASRLGVSVDEVLDGAASAPARAAPAAGRVPPPPEKLPAPTADDAGFALMRDRRMARTDLVTSHVEPGLLARANEVALRLSDGRGQVFVDDSSGGQYVASAARSGRRDTTAFGATPDEAVSKLIPHLEAGGSGLAPRAVVDPKGAVAASAQASAAAETVAAVRAELVPAGFEPPVEGLVREWTNLDNLITAGEGEQIAALAAQLAEARAQPRPPIQVSLRTAERLAKMPTTRRSYQFRRELSDAGGDFKASPSEAILSNPKNRIGVETLSVLNHGIVGTKPATIDGVAALLRDIENGAAGRMGVGPELQAEAQRVARELLDDAVKAAKRNPEDAGILTHGAFAEDERALAQALSDTWTFDQSDPLGTLQYGFKKAPTDAVVMEWSKIPGLAEEMMSGRFLPYAERAGVAEVRKAYNWIFGPRSNSVIRAEAKQRFVDRVGPLGVTPETANAIWDGFDDMSRASRMPSLRKGPDGTRNYIGGDRPLYAGVWNIPDRRLEAVAHGSSDLKVRGVIDDLSAQGKLSNEEYAAARRVDFAKAFRESSSFIRRTMADSKIPLGQAIADAYGVVAHNEVTTTLYYWFRFGLDIRYHAMNYLESTFLHWGRAGLRPGEIDEGLLGQSNQYLRNQDIDPTANTGYPFSRDRHERAYATFLKEQPDALRKGLAAEDPAVMRKALTEMARSDPQLRDMIRELDGFAPGQTIDPTRFLGELDSWHKKMLANVDEVGDAKTIDEALAKEMANTPHLSEMFDRLGQVNKELWDDVRKTFYGNPDRSRAERFLNSYLLFWPLSYQIKSMKWFAKVLFDRAGGLQTNALGAVSLDRMADTHNQLLSTDPEYRDWFEKHDTLVFVAQMFFPVSLTSTGVTLSPPLRALLFDRDPLNALTIGPIYTVNRVIRPIAKELGVDLFPTVADYQSSLTAPKK